MKDHKSDEEDYLLQDNKKTKFSIGLLSAVLIILITGVVISGVALDVF